jgi:hypothetical protein
MMHPKAEAERTPGKTGFRLSFRKTLLVLLALLLLTFGCMASVLGVRAVLDDDNDLVDFYGSLMTQREFRAETPNGMCVILASGADRILRNLAHQPVYQCFDNQYDLDQWLQSHRPPYP